MLFKREVRLLSSVLILLVIGIGVIRRSLMIATVENISMSPTLAPGDRVLVLRRWFRWSLQKGAIVLIDHALAMPNVKDIPRRIYIKRIVAVPGETLTTSLEDIHPLLHHNLHAKYYDEHGLHKWTIQPDHFFVRGDYPIGGYDSLTWGPVSSSVVCGTILAKFGRTTQ